jgi:hypothetical protein
MEENIEDNLLPSGSPQRFQSTTRKFRSGTEFDMTNRPLSLAACRRMSYLLQVVCLAFALFSSATNAQPLNDDCVNALPIGVGRYTGEVRSATRDGAATCSTSTQGYVWFRYSATGSGRVGANTFGSNFGTVLSVHDPLVDGCPGGVSDEMVCSRAQSSPAGFNAVAGNQYLVRVAAIGQVNLHIQPSGSASGQVTRESDGQPLDAVSVRLYNEFDPRYYNPPPIATVTTDALGNYLATGLRPGIYRAQTEVTGYVGEVFAELSGGGYAADPTAGTPITVSTATTTPGINFTLSVGGKISGRVVDSITGAGVVAAIYVQSTNGSGESAYATSNASGQYTTNIGQLSTGSYTVFADASDHSDELYFDLPCFAWTCNFSAGTPVSVTAGATTSGIDFTVAPATGILRGVITHNGGMDQSLAFRYVSLFDANSNIVGHL